MTQAARVKLTQETPSLRAQIKARPDFPTLYARSPLTVLMDYRLTHGDKTLCDFITFLAFPGNVCRASRAELADVAATDSTTIKRSLRRLEKYEHIRWNRRTQEITLLAPIFAAKTATIGLQLVPRCSRCPRRRSVNALGVCDLCVRQERAENEVKGVIDRLGAIPGAAVLAQLRYDGSKSSAKDIKRAFMKITGQIE